MATTEQVARDYYRQQRAVTAAATAAVVRQWAQLDRNAVAESWLAWIGRIIVAIVTRAQQQAAEQANPYLQALAEAQGATLSTSALVAPAALAGIASDGRPLDGLLYLPVIATKRWIAEGRSPREAMGHGRNSLAMLASTQVADAGRAAVSAGLTAHRQYVTYVRHLTLPSCSRCIILAGREYSWSTGFQRHPACDCVHAGVIHNGGDAPTPLMPGDVFARLSGEQQDKAFGKADAEAIRLGADISQVVNARRGMKTATMYGRKVNFTTEGTTRRGFAGRRLIGQGSGNQPPRLMPGDILKAAAGNRDEATSLLRRFGYIV